MWLTTSQGKVFPNLYTLLLAPAGIGKSWILGKIKDIWLELKMLDRGPGSSGQRLHIAPDNMTSASLIDDLAAAQTRIIRGLQTMEQYHSLLIAAPELSVLLPQYDMEFFSKLLHFYDSPEQNYIETRRGKKGEPTVIPKPQLNIIGGMTPSYLGHLLPEQAWSMGFTSRMILIYAGEAPSFDLFSTTLTTGSEHKIYKDLIADATQIACLDGELTWSAAAQEVVRTWHKSGCAPVPEHPKLMSYLPRRLVHALKLITVACVSRTNEMVISEADAVTGIAWLLEAEQHIPEVFKEIGSASAGGAGAALNELHFYMLKEYNKNGQKALHAGRLINFLASKVPTYQVVQIIDLACKSRLIQEVGPGMYKPLAKTGGDF